MLPRRLILCLLLASAAVAHAQPAPTIKLLVDPAASARPAPRPARAYPRADPAIPGAITLLRQAEFPRYVTSIAVDDSGNLVGFTNGDTPYATCLAGQPCTETHPGTMSGAVIGNSPSGVLGLITGLPDENGQRHLVRWTAADGIREIPSILPQPPVGVCESFSPAGNFCISTEARGAIHRLNRLPQLPPAPANPALPPLGYGGFSISDLGEIVSVAQGKGGFDLIAPGRTRHYTDGARDIAQVVRLGATNQLLEVASDGRGLCNEQHVRLLSAVTGQALDDIRPRRDDQDCPDGAHISPSLDGRWAAVGINPTTLDLYHIAAGRLVYLGAVTIAECCMVARFAALSPDGQRLAVVTNDARVGVFRLAAPR